LAVFATKIKAQEVLAHSLVDHVAELILGLRACHGG
jgi:hypothetical protein